MLEAFHYRYDCPESLEISITSGLAEEAEGEVVARIAGSDQCVATK